MRPIQRFRTELSLHPIDEQSIQELSVLADCPISNYMLLSMLTHYLKKNPNVQLAIDLQPLLAKLARYMSATQLWQLLHLQIWRHDALTTQQKQICRYYQLFTQWVSSYEQTISKVENQHRCFVVLEEFVRRTTMKYFERVVLLHQSYDDIRTAVKLPGFWEESGNQQVAEPHDPPNYDNLEALLQLMHLSIYRSDVNTDALGVYENQLFTRVRECRNYEHFVYCSLRYMLTNQKLLHQHEMELTKLVLRYASFASNRQQMVEVVSKVLNRSSKAVKFACMAQYQSLAAVLQAHDRSEFEQELESLHDFREMTLKKIDITELQSQPLLNDYHDTTVARGESQTFYFEVTRPNSLLMLQLHLDTNINLIVAYEGDEWSQQRSVYLKEEKCSSRSMHIQVTDCGIHSVTFDNSYSWINSKRIRWHVLLYRCMKAPNHSFNRLLDSEQYVPWRGYHLNQLVSQQQNFYYNLWKRYLPTKVDVMFRGGKVYHRGQISDVSTFQQRSESLGSIHTYVVEDDPSQYQRWLQLIKQDNPTCQLIPTKHS